MWALTILRLIGSRLLAIAGRPVASFVWRAVVAWWWSALRRRRASAARPASRGTPSTPAADNTEPPYSSGKKPVDQPSRDGLLLSQQRPFGDAVARECSRSLPGATAEGEDMNEIGHGKFDVLQPGTIRRAENVGPEMPVLGIGEALGLVCSQIERIEQQLSDLHQRMGPILAPPSTDAGLAYCTPPTDSEIPAVIVGYSCRLRAMSECMIELKCRLRL